MATQEVLMHKQRRMSWMKTLAGWACSLLLIIAGCRGEIDHQIDLLSADGISVKLNSTGEVFWIDTSGATLNEHFWETLSNFEQLEQLTLTGSPVTDADLPQLTSLHALQSLDLSYTRVTPSGLHVLSRIEDLQTLSLNGVPLDDKAVEPLCRLTRLRSLSLMDSGLENESVVGIQQALPGCLIVR